MGLSAVLAEAEDGDLPGGEGLIFQKDGAQAAQILVVHMGHSTAGFAHKVMMWDLLFDFEETSAGAEMSLPHQIELNQQLQSTVDSGHIDIGKLILDPSADFFGAHVGTVLAKHIPHQRALGGEAVPHLVKRARGVMSHGYCKLIAIAFACQSR